ncbi:ZFP1-like protein [Mya arenaria]|uniref:ZFP1-like protein n=1 Tax=Mya arenaria TaxID=6604 RepID=A0ABY7F9V5_MYAAR|nr:ZFP1-like protein [Mya arenaria]
MSYSLNFPAYLSYVGEPQPPSRITSTGGHECLTCRKQFPHKADMIRHVRMHTGEKPYQCPVCSKRFGQKCNMKSHLVVHMKGQLP